jgi:hypothetical protein
MASGSRRAESKDESVYAPSAAQVDAEQRRENDNKSSKVLSTAEVYEPDSSDTGRDYGRTGEELEGYVGTDPMYQNYAEDTEKPGVGEGVDDEIADDFVEAKSPEVATPDSLDEDSTDEGGGEVDSPPSDTPSSSQGSES